ncbi:spore germination protein [Paenibacillus sp. N4]|uniref:GerAB/ArcD/ProY family transporter n=1 Tax=Paenibacillus vietnamensis TaxID=2590547 RepID=UPI001CD10CDF|nr:endospore germination permease [Paenibacillus vietnamensis]MCA0753988.1 spore germination protein [Paenibacillus vietnamensis]
MAIIEKQTISHLQLGILFFTFMTGSAINKIPGPLTSRALNAGWISLLLSALIGFLILSCVLYLHRKFPSMTFVEYSNQLIGIGLTAACSVLILPFMLQLQSVVIVNVGVFLVTSMMKDTPLYSFTFLLFAVATVTARAGIEVMARMFTLILFYCTFCLMLVILLAIPNYHPIELLPILPKGIKPVFHGAYLTFGFPYVEIFIFSMLLPFANKSSFKQVSRAMSLSLVLNVVILVIPTLCGIMVFGTFAGVRPYLIYNLARSIDIQEIIQRIESIYSMAIIMWAYMKTTIILYVLSLYLTQLFKFKDYRTFIMPLGLIGFLLGLVSFDGAAEWENMIFTIYPLWGAIAFLIPMLLITIIASFKKRSKLVR